MDWYWQTTSGGVSTSNSGSDYTISASGIYYLRARWRATGAWSSSLSTGNIPVTNAPAAPATSTDGNVISSNQSNVLISVSDVTGSLYYRWYDQPSGGTLYQGPSGSFHLPLLQPGASQTFFVASFNGSCESPTRKSVTAYLHPAPILTVTNGGEIVFGSSVTISVTNYSYDTYQWIDEYGLDIPGATSSSYTTNSPGIYRTKVTKSNSAVFISDPISILSQNYIIATDVLEDGVTSESVANSFAIGQRNQVVQFFDGMGRPIQSIVRQGSSTSKDIVQPIVYDQYGREPKKYLPVVTGSDGWYKPVTFDVAGNYTGVAGNTYTNNASGKIAQDTRPFAETIFEASPLNRPLQSYGPGSSWGPSPGSNKFIAHQYLVNAHGTVASSTQEKVIAWKVDTNGLPIRETPSTGFIETGGYYSTGQLYVNVTVDEEGNAVREYTNKSGQIILKKVQAVLGSANLNSTTDWALTYYIYDDLGNLRIVLQPELSKRLHSGVDTYVVTQTDLNNLAFQYRYDARKRMSEKHVPGAFWVYMVYDNRDRLVLTQDGVQRNLATKYWTFTKYDELNRLILTGIKDTTASLTQAQMQGVVDTYYSLIATTKPWRKYGEKYVGTAAANNVHGYSNYSYPRVTNAATLNVDNYLTVTYYDNYTFRNDWIGTYTYLSDGLSNTSLTGTYTQVATGLENQRVIGQVTGSKIKVLDGGVRGRSTWLKTINYFDDKYRVIQTLSDNYKGDKDRTSMLYDFAGKVLKTKTSHQIAYDIVWSELNNLMLENKRLTKMTTVPQVFGNNGAVSLNKLPANQDGWVEFTVENFGSDVSGSEFLMAGLTADKNAAITTAYVFYLLTDNYVSVYTNGIRPVTLPNYKRGDIFRIERVGTTMKFYHNNKLIHTATGVTTAEMVMDIDVNRWGCGIMNARASFGGPAITQVISKSITRTFEYDHAGRLTKTWHQIDAQPQILLSKNEYNELGQLVDKKLHSTLTTASDAKQSVDYRYNIRGWLTSMNDAALTLDGSEPKDYFGMNLAYNNTDLGIGNTGLFNGNISGMTWSNNQGLGTTKENGYTFKYDAMNRLAGSYFREKTTSWSDPANNGFDERGFNYDLNGNIMKLMRFDKKVTGFMDSLVYDYNGGVNKTNQLLSVVDHGNDYKGFVDGNSSGTDYTYDNNGNLTRDLNKGIGTSVSDNTNVITYNYLNLPETVTKGGNTIRYIYDATGRKLSQVVTTGTTQKQTDYAGEFTYENDVLQYISHEEGRVMMTNTKLIYTNSYDKLPTDVTTIGATVAAYTINGQKYVSVTSGNTTAGNGILPIGTTFTVVAGDRYRVRAKGYRTTNPVYLQVKAGTTVLGNTTLPNNATNEGWVEQIVTIPAGATTMQAGMVWGTTVSANEIFYLNELDITKLETITPEYQYNLKDHLGNVRLTFTTKQETDGATATLEAANENAERSKFLRYDNARKVNHYLFDHTNGSTPTTTTGAAQRLSGKTNEIYGLARSLSVMPGDVINMEVYGKYIDSNTANLTTALNTLVSQIAAGSAPAGTVIDGGSYGSSTSSFPFPGGLNGTTSSSGTGPKAYLNWLVYDRNENLILSKCGYQRLTTAAREYGQDAAHEKLSGTVSIAEAGYVYIYLSNEEGASAYEVYFDDFKVDHIKSPVIQMDDYYPFGLAFNSYSRENSVANQYLYNGKELQDELGLNWLDYGARMYASELGRFMIIDSRSHNYMMYSPYGYVANNPINNIDFNGDFILPKEFLNKFKKLASYLKHDIQHILENKKIVDALKKHGGFSDAQLKEAFTWNKGPIVKPFEIGTLKYDDGVEIIVDGQYANDNGRFKMLINIDLVEALEKATGKDSDDMLFYLAVVILHETVHHGADINKTPLVNEEGNDFEKAAYGQLIKRSNYKEVRSNWLKMQSVPTEEASYWINTSTNSSNSSEKQKKGPDEDREAAKRSGGAY